MDVLGAKYANMLRLLKHLDLSVPKAMPCIFFSCKACSKQSIVFDLDSTITSQPIGISLKGYAHFEDNKHHGMSDWEITLIDQTDSGDDLRRRVSFWQYELAIFQPNVLNERDVTLF